MDERRRHQMYKDLERTLGRESADALMEHLPPVGWADVATKKDIEALRELMDARFEGLRDSILGQMHRALRNQFLATVTAFGILAATLRAF